MLTLILTLILILTLGIKVYGEDAFINTKLPDGLKNIEEIIFINGEAINVGHNIEIESGAEIKYVFKFEIEENAEKIEELEIEFPKIEGIEFKLENLEDIPVYNNNDQENELGRLSINNEGMVLEFNDNIKKLDNVIGYLGFSFSITNSLDDDVKGVEIELLSKKTFRFNVNKKEEDSGEESSEESKNEHTLIKTADREGCEKKENNQELVRWVVSIYPKKLNEELGEIKEDPINDNEELGEIKEDPINDNEKLGEIKEDSINENEELGEIKEDPINDNDKSRKLIFKDELGEGHHIKKESIKVYKRPSNQDITHDIEKHIKYVESGDKIIGYIIEFDLDEDNDFLEKLKEGKSIEIFYKTIADNDYIEKNSHISNDFSISYRENKIISKVEAEYQFKYFVNMKGEKPKKGSVRIIKVDAEDKKKLLKGAKFKLLDKEGNIKIENIVSDENGIVEVEGLEKGEYILKEIEAPEGYELDLETKHEFIINSEEGQVMIIKNSKEPEEPSKEPEEPSKEPEEPSKDPEEPSKEPEEPSKDPEEPSKDPEEPSNDPEEPSNEPEEPSKDPEEPSKEPEEPSKETPHRPKKSRPSRPKKDREPEPKEEPEEVIEEEPEEESEEINVVLKEIVSYEDFILEDEVEELAVIEEAEEIIVTEPTVEQIELSEELEIKELPKTGEKPRVVFYLIGALFVSMGIFLRKRFK